MKKIKDLLNFLAYTNILLGISLIFAAYVVSVILTLTIDATVLIIVFLMEFAIYNMNRYTDRTEDSISHPNRASFTEKHGKFFFLLSVLSYVIALIMTFMRNLPTFFIVILPLLIGIFYSIRWVPDNIGNRIGFRRLKDIPIIKNLVVALAWAIASVLVVSFYFGSQISIISAFLFVFMFIRFYINTVTFDMRDIKGDSKSGLKTLPIILGEFRTKIFLVSVNTILAAFILFLIFIGWLPPIAHLLNLSTVYTYIYLYLFGKRNIDNKFLCDVVVDGEYIFLGLIFILGVYFF
jgi:4-hydroxybenzoate polyprenyltransferase